MRLKKIIATLLIAIGMVLFDHPFVHLTKADTVDAVLESDDKEIHRGMAFVLELRISDNTGLIGLMVSVNFDHSAFELTSVDGNRRPGLATMSLQQSGSFDYVDDELGGFNLIYYSGNVDRTSGWIARLTFESKITAPEGDYQFDFKVSKRNTIKDINVLANVEDTSCTVTLLKGKYIVVYEDYDGTPLTENPNIDTNGDGVLDGYESNDETRLEYPSTIPTRPTDSKYSYTFARWLGKENEDLYETTYVLKFVAAYNMTPVLYNVFYYVDGLEGEEIITNPTEMNAPDGIIDRATEFYRATQVGYGERVSISVIPPHKINYTFCGWFTDEACVHEYGTDNAIMEDSDLYLFGYYKPNMRDSDYPTISARYVDADKSVHVDPDTGEEYNVLVVDLYLRDNTNLNSVIISMAYDYDKFELIENFNQGRDIFQEGQVDFHYTDFGGWNKEEEYFKLYFNKSTNSRENGRLIRLYFRQLDGVETGMYDIVFFYNEMHDATYFAPNGTELIYTKINFENAKIPIGKKYEWNQQVTEDTSIQATVQDGLPLDVELVVEVVTYEIRRTLDRKSLDAQIGSKNEIKSVYEIYMIENGVKIDPNQVVNVKIKLSDELLEVSDIKLYYYDDSDQSFTIRECQVSDGYLTFTTDHFSLWALTGARSIGTGGGTFFTSSLRQLIVLFGILSIATIGLVLILIGKNKKGKMFRLAKGGR